MKYRSVKINLDPSALNKVYNQSAKS